MLSQAHKHVNCARNSITNKRSI